MGHYYEEDPLGPARGIFNAILITLAFAAACIIYNLFF